MSEPRAVVYTGTRNLYKDMETSAKSLLYHGAADKVYFIIEDIKFPGTLPDCIHVMNMANQEYIRKDSPNWNTPWTYMALIRVAFPDIFKRYNRILSLDADTIVLGDLKGLWLSSLYDVYFAAVDEWCFLSRGDNTLYHNLGVCLMNLEKMRNEGFWQKAVNELNTNFHKFPDQDVENELASGFVLTLPHMYNYCPNIIKHRELPDDKIQIRHFAGEHYSSYREKMVYNKFASMSWDEVMDKNKKERG